MLQDVCHEIGIRQLIHEGYLAPLVSKSGCAKVDTSRLHLRGGEFVADEVEQLMDADDRVAAACAEIVELTADRSACLIFAASVRHGRHIVEALRKNHRVECGLLTGETPSAIVSVINGSNPVSP